MARVDHLPVHAVPFPYLSLPGPLARIAYRNLHGRPRGAAGPAGPLGGRQPNLDQPKKEACAAHEVRGELARRAHAARPWGARRRGLYTRREAALSP